MSSGRGEQARGESAEEPVRSAFRAILLTSLVLCLTVGALVALTAPGMAENEPPELFSGEKIDDTSVELLITDEEGIDVSTIKPGDFLLSDGEVDNIVVKEQGSNATVRINLKEPLDKDELTIEVLPDSGIQDVNGTLISDDFPSVTIEDMDGVAPRLLLLQANNATGDNATVIEAHFSEEADEIDLFIGGQTLERFGREEFEKVDDYVYRLEYQPTADGQYFTRVDKVTDPAGNSRNPTGKGEFYAFVEGPDAVATIDFTNSSGSQFTFDAGATNGSVIEYRWFFGDGTNATGERVSHEFAGGNYTVTLEAVDQYGNVGTDHLGISLPGERPEPENETEQQQFETAVNVTGNGTESADITVTNATANSSVRLSAPDGLIQDENYTLDAIRMTPNESGDYELGISTMNPEVIDGATEADNATLFGGYFVNDQFEAGQIENVTFELSIENTTHEALDAGADSVRLRRAETDIWSTLQTAPVGTANGAVQYEGTSDGFSQFAVVGTGGTWESQQDEEETNDSENSDDASADGSANLTVTSASLNRTAISPGERVEVQATVENTGGTAGDFRADLEFNGTTVETQTVTVEGGSSKPVTYRPMVNESRTVAVNVSGTDAGTLTVSAEGNSTTASELPEWMELSNITVDPTEVASNETVTVTATAENTGEELDGTTLELRANGTVVESSFVGPINPGQNRSVQFTHRVEETGNVTLAINDTEAGVVTVRDGGGLFSFLGFLGFLPIGLLRTVFLFVVVPVLFIYLGLKGVAYYLGY